MSTLYLVRHGQASFLQDDYDELSSIGIEQSCQLGRYWLSNGVEITEVYSGQLKRQRQTEHAVGDMYRKAEREWPDSVILPALDEYQADDFMEALEVELSQKHAIVRDLSVAHAVATEPGERYRTFHRLLEAIMRYYVAGDYLSHGFETWRTFHERVTDAVAQIRSNPASGRQVAVFTSGGPVGVTVQSILQAPEQIAADLNWRIFNASVTRFTFSPGRISLDQFNTIPHLANDGLRTYR